VTPNGGRDVGQRFLVTVAFANDNTVQAMRIPDIPVRMLLDNDPDVPHVHGDAPHVRQPSARRDGIQRSHLPCSIRPTLASSHRWRIVVPAHDIYDVQRRGVRL
jgi:hypothetical protein